MGEKSTKPKVCSLKRTIKIVNPLARLTNTKRQNKLLILEMKNESSLQIAFKG